MKNKLLSKLWMMGLMVAMPAMASADSIRLDQADVQAFERAYESWVQDLVHQISPKNRVNVITEFKYSSNPDLLQNYEEKMASRHLPGVPDILDLDMHPTQNPVYELVSKQNLKIILDRKPSDEAMRVMKDLISSKISLNSNRGDRIEFDFINTAAPTNRNGKIALALLLIAVFPIAGALFIQRRKKDKNRKEAAEKLNVLYNQINPVGAMISVDAVIFQEFICNQDSSLLVDAMAHGSVEFFQSVLKSFSGENRIALFSQFEKDRLKVSAKKSRYAQMYLLAKLKDQMKIDAIKKVDALIEAMEQSQIQRETMEESLSELTSGPEVVGMMLEECEVAYEQSV